MSDWWDTTDITIDQPTSGGGLLPSNARRGRIVYDGGWTAGDVPPRLARAVVILAAALLADPLGTQGLPPDAIAAGNGDLSISFARSGRRRSFVEQLAPAVPGLVHGLGAQVGP
jgi:hypothetical protein